MDGGGSTGEEVAVTGEGGGRDDSSTERDTDGNTGGVVTRGGDGGGREDDSCTEHDADGNTDGAVARGARRRCVVVAVLVAPAPLRPQLLQMFAVAPGGVKASVEARTIS